MWRMRQDKQSLSLYAGASNVPRDRKALLNPSATRLILVITDCVSPAWGNEILCDWLTTWAGKHPTGLLQMLPQQMWSRSNLAHARFNAVRALRY